jgi:hypothetical protein
MHPDSLVNFFMQTLSKFVTGTHKIIVERPNTVLFVVILWLSLEYVIFGPFSFVNPFDSVHYVSSQLALSHASGNWYPFGVAGIDLPSMQFVVPISQLLHRIFHGFLAYQIQILAAFSCATIFTFLLLRDKLKLKTDVSLVGAATYGIGLANPYSVNLLDFALIPAIIWLLGWTTSRKGIRALIGVLVLGFFFASMSSVVMAIPFVPIGVAIWYLLVERQTNIRFWLLKTIMWATYGILKIPDIWSLLLYLPISERVLRADKNYDAADSWSDVFDIFSGFLSASNHLFVLILIAGITILILRPRSAVFKRVLLIFPGLAAVMLFSFLLLRGGTFFVERGLNTFGFGRLVWVIEFFVIVAAAIAMDLWRKKEDRLAKTICSIVIVGLFVGFLGLSINTKLQLIPAWSFRGGYAAIYEKPAIQEIANEMAGVKPPFRVGVYYAQPAQFQAYGLETITGWYSMYSLRYRRFLEALNNFEVPSTTLINAILTPDFNLALSSLANAKYFLSYHPLVRKDLELVAGPEVHSWRLSMTEKIKFALRFNFGDSNKVFIYRNSNVFPRFFLTHGVRTFANSENMLHAMANADIDVLKENAYLEWSDADGRSPPKPDFRSGEVRLVSYRSDTITMDVEADGTSFLVVTNSFSPYWKAYVDGVDTPILPAYHTFWGIEVREGRHRVEWRYEPPYQKVEFLNLLGFWSFDWLD